jgi:hypothetical protein
MTPHNLAYISVNETIYYEENYSYKQIPRIEDYYYIGDGHHQKYDEQYKSMNQQCFPVIIHWRVPYVLHKKTVDCTKNEEQDKSADYQPYNSTEDNQANKNRAQDDICGQYKYAKKKTVSKISWQRKAHGGCSRVLIAPFQPLLPLRLDILRHPLKEDYLDVNAEEVLMHGPR